MKTNFKYWTLALALCLLPSIVPAQEYLTSFNHHNADVPVATRERTVLTLPFYDDFSNAHLYPDNTKWIDRNVFVNSGFPKNPVTRNAATFDVLDDHGQVYDYAISNTFIADYLTSATIRLDSLLTPEPQALTPADSVYLSFFYQPQGFGNIPEFADSLVLEFYANDSLGWQYQWSATGQSLQQFIASDSVYFANNGSCFKMVMIPITDPMFFTDQFAFRFYNCASIANNSSPSSRGNEDNWNIDAVYLDCHRSSLDKSYPKICFTGTTPSFLNRYQSMPYKHYRSNPYASVTESFVVSTSNLDNQSHNLKHQYTVKQVNGNQEYSYSRRNPIRLNAQTYCSFDTTFVNQLFSLDDDRDSTSFIITQYISDSTCNPPMIDSIVYRQGFYNYFAYDDGIPEMGFGIGGASGSFAVRFDLSEMDTLRGVQILFNHTLHDANNKFFDIVVWRDNNGKPGDVLFRMNDRKPKWEDGLYQFTFYPFNQFVKVNGTFYVGIIQQTPDMINIGFDASKDNSRYNFVNSNGIWEQSTFAGSIMIRPVVGADYLIGVEEEPALSQVTVYPNPASTTLHIEGVENGTSIALYDLTGRKVMHEHFSEELSLGNLSNGLYLLKIITADGTVISRKIMVRQ